MPMKVRVYTDPFSGVNENWNTYGTFQADSHDRYKHPIIPELSYNDFWNNGAKDFQQDFYKKFGIDIVTETVFNYPYPAITEKTLLPIVNKRMFLIVGPANTLKFLQSQGFHTFSPFINETYDDISDPVKRMEFILSEIDRLVALPIDSIQEAVLQYADVLESNFMNIMNLEKYDLQKVKERLLSI